MSTKIVGLLRRLLHLYTWTGLAMLLGLSPMQAEARANPSAALPQCTVSFSDLSLSPSEFFGSLSLGIIVFKDVPTSTSVEMEITLSSNSDCPVTVLFICFPDTPCRTSASGFELLNLPIGQILRKDSPQKFKVRFTSGALLGEVFKDLFIVLQPPVGPSETFLAAVKATIVKRTPRLSCPDPDLGIVSTGVRVTIPVTITNIGGDDLALRAVALSPDTSPNFKLETPFFPSAIGPNGSSTGELSFFTPADFGAGTFKGSLVFTTNEPNSPTTCFFQVTAVNIFGAPTLSQWGQIIMTLLLLSVGMSFIVKHQVLATQTSLPGETAQFRVKANLTLLVPALYCKVLAVVFTIVIVGFLVAIWASGPFELIDIAGVTISALVVAYLIELCILAAKNYKAD